MRDSEKLGFRYNKAPTEVEALSLIWCPRTDLNRHSRRKRILNPSCIPISPLGQMRLIIRIPMKGASLYTLTQQYFCLFGLYLASNSRTDVYIAHNAVKNHR